MSRRRLPKGRGTRRRQGTRQAQQPPNLLIVCEGVTEQHILLAIRRHFRIRTLNVHIEAQAGGPSSVVRKAKALGRELKPDETWVAFDRDEHPCWGRAIDQARANGMRLAISNPCIELWGLLLHQPQTAFVGRHAAQSQLKRLHPGYDHHKNPRLTLEVVLDEREIAAERARTLRDDSERLGESFRNPLTYFDLLVDRLIGMAT